MSVIQEYIESYFDHDDLHFRQDAFDTLFSEYVDTIILKSDIMSICLFNIFL